MNTQRFFLSEVDGHLYRDGNLDVPFRKDVAKFHRKIKTVAELKATIRAAGKAFGGTSLVLQMSDGGLLCEACANKEFNHIAAGVRDQDRSGWNAVAACMDNELDPCVCDGCGEDIVLEEESGLSDEPNFDDDFVDSDPWRGGPDGDLYG